jgi:hypothetical protein
VSVADTAVAHVSEGEDPLAQLDAGPIFVCGHIRSGTTWVLDVLGAHPLVANLFESLIFTGNGLGQLLDDFHFSQDLQQSAFGRTVGLGQLLTREEALADLRRLCDAWLAEALEPRHRYLVEKTPADAAAMNALAALYPDASVVHVLRDGRDVAISTAVARRTWQRKEELQDSPREGATDLWRIGLRWQNHVTNVRGHALSLPLPFHEVRYEDMHAKPVESARRLFQFCQIPCDNELLERIVEQTHFSKLPKAGPTQFRRSGQVGGWRREWSRWQLLLFTAAAGEALEQTGYAGPVPKRAQQLRDLLMRFERAKRWM